jgi:hypothetical protein
MNRPSDVDVTLLAWLREGPSSGPDEVLSSAVARTRTTRQDRAWLPDIALPARFQPMNQAFKLAAVAAFALAIGIAFGPLLTRSPYVGSEPSPSPSASPSPTAAPLPLNRASGAAGTYTVTPFVGAEWAPCGPAPNPCPEASIDDTIRFTLTLPDGWTAAPFRNDIWLAGANNSGPEGAGMLLGRGGWMFSDPCEGEQADIPIGPTVDEFVDAMTTSPLLETTTPVDIELSGYPGKYFELQGPADLTDCQYFMAYTPTFYAQGASNLQPFWVVDVDGVRVVVHGSQFPETPPERVAELRAIVESLVIEP